GEQDARAVEDGVVQLEPAAGVAVGVVAPVVEEKATEPRALDPLQELLGDDLVGVDVGAVEDGDARGRPRERPHRPVAASSRTSTKWPAIAAAGGLAATTRWG